jgi:hypothetical protein
MTLAIETGLNRLTSSIVWVDMSLELPLPPLSLSLSVFFYNNRLVELGKER